MKEKYIKPASEEIAIRTEGIIASSGSYHESGVYCDDDCKLWHICRDRTRTKICEDKKSKW